MEFDLLDAAATTRFDAACKAAGGKLISGLYAALAITDHEVAGRADYYGMSVLGSRDRGNFLLAQGWMCNFAPVAFHTAGSSSFEELVAVAHEGHLRAKRLADSDRESERQLIADLSAGRHAGEVGNREIQRH